MRIQYCSILLILTFFIAACSSQQKLTKEAYQNGFENKKPFTTIEDVSEDANKQMRIYLIRHAKPDVNKELLYNSAMAQAYVRAYGEVSIIPFDSSLVNVKLEASTPIYCSNLRRAQETARAIFGEEYIIISEALFREFETRINSGPNAYSLPLIVWQSISRLMWVMGLNQHGIESYNEARRRADKAANRLIELAEENRTVVLVAHGMLNRALAKRLKQQGWELIQNKGHINIGATVLEKER